MAEEEEKKLQVCTHQQICTSGFTPGFKYTEQIHLEHRKTTGYHRLQMRTEKNECSAEISQIIPFVLSLAIPIQKIIRILWK